LLQKYIKKNISFIYGKIFIAHDIFPFVNVFVVTNILTRNYHEFLYFFSLSQYILQSMILKKIIAVFYNSGYLKIKFLFYYEKIKLELYSLPSKLVTLILG